MQEAVGRAPRAFLVVGNDFVCQLSCKMTMAQGWLGSSSVENGNWTQTDDMHDALKEEDGC